MNFTLGGQVKLYIISFFRKAMPLCENEGIYVRDTQSGSVSEVLAVFNVPQYFL